MIPTAFSKSRSIPSASTRKSEPTTTNFVKGILTYRPNDLIGNDALLLAQDARFDRIGEYITRRGLSKLSDPIGKQAIFDNYDSGYELTTIPVTSSVFTVPSDSTIYSVNITAAASTGGYGVLRVKLIGSDGSTLAASSIDPDLVSATAADFEVAFIGAPHVKSGESITVSVDTQRGTSGEFSVATIEGALMLKINTATSGRIMNVFEANIDGVVTVLFAFDDQAANVQSIYRLNADGGVAKIRDLPSGVKSVRFNQDLNQIRYSDGVEGPHLIDPAQDWADTEIPTIDLTTETDLGIKVGNIMDGAADNIMYFDAETNTQAVWTYPYGYMYKNTPQNSYDNFDRDFRQNFPAILTGDPLTAMFNLGGVIYVMTRRNKYQMFVQAADVWTQSASNAQNGTFSQESIVCDLNYAYFASDHGIFVFDGASETSITEGSIQNVYDSIRQKESITLELFNNRLYAYFSSRGDGVNDTCLVYNTNLRVWESFDTDTYVGATSGRQNASNRFICGHSKLGMLMLAEEESNRYDNLGGALHFDLETAYSHFGSPSQYKRITKWRPEFSLAAKPYSVECGYALDFTDTVKYAFSVSLDSGVLVRDDYIWDNPDNYGVNISPSKLSTIPSIYGEFRRCQIRYQHHAAFEPVNFKSHTLTIQTQRLR